MRHDHQVVNGIGEQSVRIGAIIPADGVSEHRHRACRYNPVFEGLKAFAQRIGPVQRLFSAKPHFVNGGFCGPAPLERRGVILRSRIILRCLSCARILILRRQRAQSQHSGAQREA